MSPEIHEYDVIVAGGGTAGSAAAIAAARMGAKTLLIEEQNCLGGVSTAGGVGEWFAHPDGLGDIFAGLVREMERFGVRKGRFFNPEYMKFAWQYLAELSGVELLLHASVIGAERFEDRLTAIHVACSSRVLELRARYFIDATGEGDLAALAGAEFMHGDAETGLLLHMTLTGWLYDSGSPATPYLPDGMSPIMSDAELPGLAAGWHVDTGRVFLNATKIIRHDPTDPFSLTKAECAARRQLFQVLHYVQRTRLPNHVLGGTGATIGIREGRRIIGDFVLTQDMMLDRNGLRDFPDGIAVATSQIDFHSLTKQGGEGWREAVMPYAIPFRCLMVKGFGNCLTAGKCISVDQVVHSSCRMTPTCCAMGQAAGTAVALAVAQEVSDIRSISMTRLRETLECDGIWLDPARHSSFRE